MQALIALHFAVLETGFNPSGGPRPMDACAAVFRRSIMTADRFVTKFPLKFSFFSSLNMSESSRVT